MKGPLKIVSHTFSIWLSIKKTFNKTLVPIPFLTQVWSMGHKPALELIPLGPV